ncbi:hypothetical protein T265_09577 [Opisthorchis viverrini]|uniref:Uncharacterized protein n=1 Tax=Opisthorchis viverrini TaxID=6198 RepID=A0A074Z9P7_OPIVI|nr:hypothetical protein T265_09577 [Opisthorchis viverrini]KER22292.1 hypothetical protein T265_09577 [Opisthorchis viverrini]
MASLHLEDGSEQLSTADLTRRLSCSQALEFQHAGANSLSERSVVRTQPQHPNFSCLSLGDDAVSRPLYFIRTAWPIGTEKVLQLDDSYHYQYIPRPTLKKLPTVKCSLKYPTLYDAKLEPGKMRMRHLIRWTADRACLLVRWPKWLEREFTDRKVRGSNPTSAFRLPLSRLGQPGSIPALVQLSGDMAVRHRKGAAAGRISKKLIGLNAVFESIEYDQPGSHKSEGMREKAVLKLYCLRD